jgi:inositol phosphorylceramide synthase catalytic subunit
MKRVWTHMRSLWPRYTLLPAAPFVLWSIYCLARGERRFELVLIIIVAPLLAYYNETTRRLFRVALPFALVGLIYDAMRFVKNVGVSETSVHLCDLRAAEMRFFGVTAGGVRMTLHDWIQPRATPVLDLLMAIPYGTYLFVPMGYAVYLFFRDYDGARRFAWSFLALNILGFVTYHLYPAAPPWYFHERGCTVDLAAQASEGANLARVDAWLGIAWFRGLYGRSNDVFGAVPSLHVAYPLLMVLEGWGKHRAAGRVLTVLWFVATCVAAVYLDHHWIIDIIVGLAFTVITYYAIVIGFASGWRFRTTSPLPPAGVQSPPVDRLV